MGLIDKDVQILGRLHLKGLARSQSMEGWLNEEYKDNSDDYSINLKKTTTNVFTLTPYLENHSSSHL